MTEQSLFDQIIEKYNDPSSSIIHAAYRHFRWKVRLGIRRILFPLINKYPNIYRYYFKFQRQLQPEKFTDSDPLKIIWVDPDQITKTCKDNFGRPLQRGAIHTGEWDQNTGKFMSRDIPKQVQLYFDRNKKMCENIQTKINSLTDSISSEGYLTQKELLDRDEKKAKSANNDPVPTVLNEITVNIGRNGEFLWRTYGQHRLAVAKMLDIDRVPVLICVRHKKWQEVRNKLRQAQKYEWLPSDLSDQSDQPDQVSAIDTMYHSNDFYINVSLTRHPDLQDILNG